ncbi:MAG: peptide-methionine (S)-S-oxide reductase MsrA [Chloroflexi bacterium]|nr:peptide-methionine (S)-S-oxide reductase MsrA [Chloroflexota bacterium]
MAFGRKALQIPSPAEALPGRSESMPVPEAHLVLGTQLRGPWPEGHRFAMFGMGCFWGTEKFLARVPGVHSSFVGYSGGHTPNPTYEEVCSGLTGHNEVAVVVYDPAKASYEDFLKVFWENHDPTQWMRQGNDIGTQYRSEIYWFDEEQREAALRSRERYQRALREAGYGEIVTEIVPVGPFYYAEPYHQQYLARFPRGYCNHGFCQVAYEADGSRVSPGARAVLPAAD